MGMSESESRRAEFHEKTQASASIDLVKQHRIDPFPIPMLAINGIAAFSGEAWTAGTPPSLS